MSVLVGSLPSREGRAALRVATQECLTRQTDLVVIDGASTNASAEESADWLSAVQTAEATLSAAGRSLQHRAGDGDVAQGLVDASEGADADLIVIGLRRRTPVGKLLLGSHAQRVLLEAGCPVLAVKADDSD